MRRSRTIPTQPDIQRASAIELETSAVVLVCAAIETLTTAADKLDDGVAQEAGGYLRDALEAMVETLGIEDPSIVRRGDSEYVASVAYAALAEQIAELQQEEDA